MLKSALLKSSSGNILASAALQEKMETDAGAFKFNLIVGVILLFILT